VNVWALVVMLFKLYRRRLEIRGFAGVLMGVVGVGMVGIEGSTGFQGW